MLFSFALTNLLAQFLSSTLADQAILTPVASPLDSNFAHLVDQTLEEFNVPGVAIGVIDGDEIFTNVSLVFFAWLDEAWRSINV